MLKYIDVVETFAEVPDEISLCISISGCPIHCKGCHSKYLWEDKGKSLTWESLNALINIHIGITCVCLMGGDQDSAAINRLARHIKHSTDLKVCWYSGKSYIDTGISTNNFDYIKIGPYEEQKGPLNNINTNQRFYAKGSLIGKLDADKNTFYDITYKFWNKNEQSKSTEA